MSSVRLGGAAFVAMLMLSAVPVFGQADSAKAKADSTKPKADSTKPNATVAKSLADTIAQLRLQSEAADSVVEFVEQSPATDTAAHRVALDKARTGATAAYHKWIRADTAFRPHGHVIASGDLKTVVGQSGDATSTTGSLGVRYEGTRFQVTGSLNLAAKVDTVRSSFGATLLTTASGSSLNAGLIDIRVWHLFRGSRPEKCFTDYGVDDWRCNIGFRFYGSASSSFWRDTIRADSGKAAISVVTWTFYGGAFYAFSAGRLGGKDLSVIFNAGLVQRAVRGDLLGATESAVHQVYLGTSKSDFLGFPSLSLEINYANLRGSLEYVKMEGTINGFSRGQVIAAMAVQTDLVSGIIGGAR